MTLAAGNKMPSFEEMHKAHIARMSGGEHRSQIDLLYAVLKALQEPKLQTHVLYLTGINHYQLHRYKTLLLGAKMIEVDESTKMHSLTNRGKALLDALRPMYNEVEE